jgi:hypothetical protein
LVEHSLFFTLLATAGAAATAAGGNLGKVLGPGMFAENRSIPSKKPLLLMLLL